MWNCVYRIKTRNTPNATAERLNGDFSMIVEVSFHVITRGCNKDTLTSLKLRNTVIMVHKVHIEVRWSLYGIDVKDRRKLAVPKVSKPR